jgi:hypothetical protein
MPIEEVYFFFSYVFIRSMQSCIYMLPYIYCGVREFYFDLISFAVDGRKTELGPALGMKKSSSLESLQTMVQEVNICLKNIQLLYLYTTS